MLQISNVTPPIECFLYEIYYCSLVIILSLLYNNVIDESQYSSYMI